MYIVIAVLIEIFVSYMVRTIYSIDTVDGTILVLINVIIFMLWAITNKKMTKNQRMLIIMGYLVRIILLIVDRYITTLPYNNSDAVGFNNVAISIANNLSLLKENLYGGIFTKILGILYYLVGENRIFAQNINIMLGMAAIYNMFTIINTIKIKNKFKNNFLQALLVFLPQTLLLSVVLLREIIVVYFISVSFKYCWKYTRNGNKIDGGVCLLSILIASSFHAGALFLITGYILILSFYSIQEKRIKLSTKKVSIFVILIIILSIVYMRFGSVVATKLTIMDEEKLANSFEGESKGGSAYLGGKEINNVSDMIIYTIPKVLYFLFSPMPWDWRGISDITSFAIDSIVYLYLIYNIIKNRNNIDQEYKAVVNLLIVGLAITVVAFAVGTSNAGTAIRHRHKLFEYFLMITILHTNNTKNKIVKENII